MPDRMTDGLVAHAGQVCATVLGPEAAAAVSISAHPAGDDLPGHISATHEYMIVVDFSQAPALLPDAIQRLSSFLGKTVVAQEDNPPACLYWGEGDPLACAPIAPTSSSVALPVAPAVASPYASVEWMKSDTVLPNWLDEVLFDTLGARHEPDWQRYEHNLDLNKDEIKVYLGTYFPRSYAEAFCILDALLGNDVYGAFWKHKTEASILDVGTGTGGNLVGILTALAKHCPNLTQVTVHAYDGNTLALDAARTVLASFASRASFDLHVALTEQRITSLDDLPAVPCPSYNFITTFKMGGEIISRSGGMADEFYHRFLATYSGLLSDSGLMILLDVTTKPEHTAFLPQLMNEQVSRFVREHDGIATLMPVPCHLYESHCSEPCFTQQEFSVTHRLTGNDKSRVAYRVLTSTACAQALHETTDKAAKYVICAKPMNDTFNTCTHSSGSGKPLDGYRIST